MSAGLLGPPVSEQPFPLPLAVNRIASVANAKGLKWLQYLANRLTDSADIVAALALVETAQDAAAQAAVQEAQAAAREQADERHRGTVVAHEEHSRKLRAEHATAAATVRALEAMPKTHAAAALRIAGAMDLAAVKATVRQRIDHSRDTVATLKARYAEVHKANDTLRMLGFLPGGDGQAEGAAEIGLQLCLGDENAIREAAEERAQMWLEAYAASPSWRAAERDQPWLQAERECPRWHRRRIRRDVRGAQAWLDCALRMARPTSPAVSGFTLGAWRQVQERSAAWSAGMAVRFEDGQEVPLQTIQERSRKARRAQMYAVAKGMEHEGARLGYYAFFISITLPGDLHSFTSGERDAEGNYPNAHSNPNWKPKFGPKAQWKALQGLWELFRSRLADHHPLRQYMGITVPEPHKNGSPHLHAMLWLPRAFQTGHRTRNTALVLNDILHDLAPGRQSRIEIVRKRPDRIRPDGSIKRYASPASYVMKYVLESLDAEAAAGGESYERHRAWASSRGIRRIRLLGVHGSLRIWQRLWTSPDDEVLPTAATAARAAMRRCAAAGEEAAAAKAGSPERAAAKLAQAEAAADALRHLGALPGATTRLRLGYEDGLTEYGRATKKPSMITEENLEVTEEEYRTPVRGLLRTRTVTAWTATGATMPLRRQKAELVPAEASETIKNRNGLTVVAIGPRAGAAPQPQATPEDSQAADMLQMMLYGRAGRQAWADWCAGRWQQLHNLRYPPPAPAENDDLVDKTEQAQVA